MLNYKTRLNTFENNYENTTKSQDFILFFEKLVCLDQREDEQHIYIDAVTKSTSCRCPKCNRKSTILKDKKIVYPLLGTLNDKSIIARITKKRFKCIHCNCSFVEETPLVAKRKQISNRILNTVVKSLINKDTYTRAAKRVGVSIGAIIRLFDSLNIKFKRYTTVKNILIDELRLIAYNWRTKIGKFQLAVMDADTGEIIDILPDRRKAKVQEYLIKNFSEGSLETVTSDLWKPYKQAVEKFNELTGNNVQLIADKFHFVRQMMWDIDKLRISTYKQYIETTPQDAKLLKNAANRLRARKSKLSTKSLLKLQAMFEKFPTLYTAYHFKERYLTIVQTSETAEDFENQYELWLKDLKKSPLQAQIFKGTIKSHKNFYDAIKNAFDYPYSNGLIEGTNQKMKLRKANAYGFKNYERTIKYIKLTTGKRKVINQVADYL